MSSNQQANKKEKDAPD